MKELLVVIDMQNDFVTGSLGTKEACGIVDNVKNKIEEYVKKGQEIDEEVRSRIYALETDGDKLFMTLATGNENLRVDSFVESLSRFGVRASANDIVRIEQFASLDGRFVAAKEILQ